MDIALYESTQEKIPSLLEDILKRILVEEESELKQTDIFIILVAVLAYENGFLLMTNNTIDLECWKHIDNKYLLKWKSSNGVYELTFVMNGFHDTLVKFVLCSLESSSLINVVISNINSEVYSVCFNVNHYIVDLKASTIPMMFCDLNHLSNTFKNKIITPVKSAILNYYGYSGASLFGLPEELIFKLMLYLDVSDIINISKTCKKLNLLLNNDSLWHKLFLRDFPLQFSCGNTTEGQWKMSYRNMQMELKESLRRVRKMSPIDFSTNFYNGSLVL